MEKEPTILETAVAASEGESEKRHIAFALCFFFLFVPMFCGGMEEAIRISVESGLGRTGSLVFGSAAMFGASAMAFLMGLRKSLVPCLLSVSICMSIAALCVCGVSGIVTIGTKIIESL